MCRYKHSKLRQLAYLKRWTKKSKSRKSLSNYFDQMQKEYEIEIKKQAVAMELARHLFRNSPIGEILYGLHYAEI
jgi:hypothetical protein